jgi:hypothetical protein
MSFCALCRRFFQPVSYDFDQISGLTFFSTVAGVETVELQDFPFFYVMGLRPVVHVQAEILRRYIVLSLRHMTSPSGYDVEEYII